MRFPEFGQSIQTLIIETPRFSRLTTKVACADTNFRPWKSAVLKGDGFAVCYPKEMPKPAKPSLQELQKQRDFLSQCWGIELAEFGVNLVSGDF